MKKNKVDIIWGEAVLTSPTEIKVAPTKKQIVQPQGPIPKNALGEGTYKAKNIIIATGARPRVLPGIEPDGEKIWTYFEAMKPAKFPKSLVIMGSGAIGMEFASFYRSLGAEVTVVELLPTILPVEDAEIAAHVKKRFEKRGIKIITDAKVAKVEKTKDGIVAHVEPKTGEKSQIAADALISAVGVQCNSENLGLEALGVKIDRGAIVIDHYGRTNVPSIWAIGDVAGPPMLAHKAEHEAGHHRRDHRRPQGRARARQAEGAGLHLLRAAGRERRPHRGQGQGAGQGHQGRPLPFVGNGKAIALGEPEGLVKTIFDAKTGELLGAHMVGAEVTELIQGFVVAMGLETTEEELMHTIFPHPTLSETMKESVLDAYGRALNI